MKKHLLFILALGATILSSRAQTAISANGIAPDASAMFDVDVASLGVNAKKGMLIPRVSLTGTADVTTIPSAAISLLVYNTNAGMTGGSAGYYFWNGSAWVRLISGSSNNDYIQNQFTSAQSANYWINGNARIEGNTYIGPNANKYFYASVDRIIVAAESTTDVAEFASYGLYLPKTNAYNLYVGGGAQMAYSTAGYIDFRNEGGISTNTGTLNMYFKNSGFVGIGTTGPSAKFHVAGGGQILGTNGTSSNTRTLTILEDGDTQTNFGSYPGAWTSALQIQSNDPARYLWLSPISTGGNARLVTIGSDFEIYPGNVLTSTFASSGDVTTARYHFAQYFNSSDNSQGSGVTGVMVKAGDNYLRTGTAAAVATFLGTSLAGNYIQNQNASAQTANFWVSGSGRFNGNITSVGDIFADQNYGMGLVGVYTSTRYQNVFAMGAAYRLPADGSTTGNLYGLAWSHPNAGGIAGNLNTHGLLVMENGTFLAAVSGSIRARDDMRAPIFYDQNNTAFYVDPNVNALLNKLRVDQNGTTTGQWGHDPYGYGWGAPAGSFRNLEVSSSGNYSNEPAMFRIHQWGSGSAEFWKPQGTTMYLRETPGGGGGWFNLFEMQSNARVTGNFYAPIMYDNNDNGYYVDPNGTSEMNLITNRTRATMGNSGLYNTPRHQITGDTRYWTGSMGWDNTDLNVLANWGSGFFDSWSSPANGPGTTSHYVGHQALHFAGGGVYNHGYQMVSTTNANRWHLRSNWGSGWSPWVEMAHSGNIGSIGSGSFIQNQWGGNQSANFHISGSGRAGSDLRAPIFYDENNTGYYTDPSSVSNLAGITTSVNYNTFHTWTNLPNHTGLFSSNHNGAHFYPNDGSYGSWRILGTRNGWGGIEFPSGAGNISLMIGQGGWGGMTTGMHANSYGWLWRFEHQTLYAARWVDSDNNGYYFDGHSTSLVTGDFYISHNGGVLRIGHGGYGGDWCCGGYDWWGCQGWCSNIRLSVYGGAESLGWYGWSDGRFKKDVQTVSNALDLVKSMRGVFYNWTFEGTTPSYDDLIKAANKTEYNPMDIEASSGAPPGSRIGVIAQEIQEVLPQVVTRVEDKDTSGAVIGHHYSVNYNDLVPVLIEAIKEQQMQIEELKAKVFGTPLETKNNFAYIESKLNASNIPDKTSFTEFIQSLKNKTELDQREKLKLEMLKTKLGIK